MAFTSILLIDLLAVLTSIFAGILLYFTYVYKFWEKKGVPFIKPSFPKGNNVHLLMDTVTFGTETKVWYDEFKRRGCKFGGVWSYARPVLVLVDPEYIKDILTIDFNHFVDRDFYYNEKDDPTSAHLFVINSESWRNIRAKLSPTFTSGKMKIMFNGVLQCSDYMIEALEKDAVQKTDVDIREVLARFTTDVIGSVAFGVECNSFKEPEAEFRQMGQRIFAEIGWIMTLKVLCAKTFPGLSRKLGIGVTEKVSHDFFANLVKETVKYREENGITRPDFMQLLIDLKNDTKDSAKPFTMPQMSANVFLFFVAGFDTSTTSMNFALYELARNPDLQEKARQEIEKVLEKHDGKIDYDSIKNMTYIRQVMDETLRMYPPLPALARICVKDYKLRNTDITIEKGTPVVISTLGLGRNEEYFPSPEKFDAERFSPENKANLPPYVHLPFGEGPRNCIGLRFGVMQSTIGLVRILRNFKLSISPRTDMPLTLNSHVFLTKSNETLYLKIEKL